MVHIISKRDGPRNDEVAAKKFVEKNRAAIDGIANRLTGGRWQEMRNPTAAPKPELSGKLWFIAPSHAEAANPYVRISLNGRVVVADLNSGRQLHFIGDIRGAGAARRFALAIRENGFFAPLEEDLQRLFLDLDGMALPDALSEERLERHIADRLGLVTPDKAAD